MNNISQFLQNIRSAGGIKGKLRKRLFASVLDGFDAVNRDLELIYEDIAELKTEIDKCNKRIDDLAAENVTDRQAYQHDVKELSERIDGSNDISNVLRNDFEALCVNVRSNNSAIESLTTEGQLLKLKLSRLEKNSAALSSSANTTAQTVSAAENPSEGSSDYDDIDYFDFENHFRGSIDSIKKAQSVYLPYFSDKKSVLDIGCGRGEFLSLMKDNGISAKGVDIYEPYVEYCNMNGLEAVCADGARYISQCGDVDGIFLGQVVEHLNVGQIMAICEAAYEKLPKGGCIVIETPNPTSLAIYTNAFYIDPSHVKPVHPMTMRYYLEKAGFTDINVIFTEGSRPPYSIPELRSDNAEEFNEAMKHVSDLLYGSQDYAVIAVK